MTKEQLRAEISGLVAKFAQLEFEKKIGKGVTIRDTCLGGSNCKFGVHNIDELVNNSDLLTGVSDDTFTKEQYLQESNKIDLSIADLNSRIINMQSIINSNKKKDNKILKNKISKFNKIIFFKKRQKRHIPRTKHLTEGGLVPFSHFFKEKQKAVKEQQSKLDAAKNVSKKSRKIIKKPKF